ncbi:MAG: carbamoyltransferase HypF [Methylococcaceae bacterium]|nr:carbamoyltransferase HypF [Methylococcaceae bacterium]
MSEVRSSTSSLDRAGRILAEKELALTAAIHHLREGKIIALKGIGGFQLLVDANQEKAIERLRYRKHRPKKPFAIMVSGIADANKLCLISEEERMTLLSYAAPIVLLKRQETIGPNLVSKAVAPDTSLLGIMLPYSPLHHLLLHEFDGPLVVTSGNRQDEPLCIDDQQALDRLKDIADVFLTHNRPIVRPLDDSIVRTINGKTTVLRRARGYSSLPISLNTGDLSDTIAVGGQLKNTVAVCQDNHAILSQHLGDLDSEASQQQYQNTLADLQQLYQIKKTERVMRDLHPGYVSSHSAENFTWH